MGYDLINIGERIKKERKETLRISQLALVEDLGIRKNTLVNIEKGRKMPDMDTLRILCDLLDCDMGYLLCEYDERHHVNADVAAEIHLSESAINKLRKLLPTYSQILSSIIEHDDFAELLRTIDNKCNKKAHVEMFKAATLFHIVEGAELSLTDSDSVIYQGNGHSMPLYDHPQDIETAIDLRINKLLYKIIENIPIKKDDQ